MESQFIRKFWRPSENKNGYMENTYRGSAKEALQFCLAKKWPWFVLEHCWGDVCSWPHAAFISTKFLDEYVGDVKVDGERVNDKWGVTVENSNCWCAGAFPGYRQCDLSSEEIQDALEQLVKLKDPEKDPGLQYYEFSCTDEEYDPQRVIREAVEDGRLWFIYQSTRFEDRNVLCIRRDFLARFSDDNSDAVLGEYLGPDWGWQDTFPAENDCPRGYKAHLVGRGELRRVIRTMKSLKPKPEPAPKKTHRIYYYGGE